MTSSPEPLDAVLIGAGVMSATLGAMLKKRDASLRIAIFERLDTAAAESSDAWNNAGTGHAGYCELNYTPQRPDGTVDSSKAEQIAAQFAQSRRFWSALVAGGELPAAATFIRSVPHISFVQGERDVGFLRERAAQLARSPLFSQLEFTEDPARIASWIPLVMEGRAAEPRVAATRVMDGTDVNFGALTKALMTWLAAQPGVTVAFGHEVTTLQRDAGGGWQIEVGDMHSDARRLVRGKFVFIGAGGYSLDLLSRTGIPEADGYGAFPVSGQFLRCVNDAVIARHHAKVYGRADEGAPPMSVPHLDTRWIDGRQQLLFGPYAGVTTKFLKHGSWLDLLGSIGIRNVRPVLSAGLENLDLTRYLMGQALLGPDERIALLQRYLPLARSEDWELQVAGLRVQIIKRDADGSGELKFGTEVVTSADGTVAALLGASPGASTAVAIMNDLIARCFPRLVDAAQSDAAQSDV